MRRSVLMQMRITLPMSNGNYAVGENMSQLFLADVSVKET